MTVELRNNLDILKKEFNRLRVVYNVKRIGIFGSYSRGEQSKSSDIDILVEFSEPIGLLDYIGLKNHLSTLIKRNVDLTTKKALKPMMKKEVLKEIIYA